MPILQKPITGWTCELVYDLKQKSPDETIPCELCKHSRLRYVHVLSHSHYPATIEVGCCCAVRLCDEYDATAAERDLRNRALRLRTFAASHHWKPSRSNPSNLVRKIGRGRKGNIVVTIFSKFGRISSSVKVARREPIFPPHQLRFATTEEAKTWAFDEVEALKSETRKV